jgi:hypothetical protein
MIYPDIVRLHPLPPTFDREVALRCIAECLDCIASCTACADDCLSERDMSELVRCVRLDLDCSDVCEATVRVVSRQTMPDLGVIRTTVQACAAALPGVRRRVRTPRGDARTLSHLRADVPPMQAGLR